MVRPLTETVQLVSWDVPFRLAPPGVQHVLPQAIILGNPILVNACKQSRVAVIIVRHVRNLVSPSHGWGTDGVRIAWHGSVLDPHDFAVVVLHAVRPTLKSGFFFLLFLFVCLFVFCERWGKIFTFSASFTFCWFCFHFIQIFAPFPTLCVLGGGGCCLCVKGALFIPTRAANFKKWNY